LGHEPHLYPTLTALENLRFFARLHDVPKADAEIALAVVGLERLGDSLVRHLSKGETQRVGLARALIHDPKVLLVDEPFSGLDADASDALPQLLKSEGRTVIIATHDAERARRFSDRTITLQDGSAA
jgi:ABC-type multidrug transport system ATPase subunit